MASQPAWLRQLNWSTPKQVANLQRSDVPWDSGCYAFTLDPRPLLPEQVLYIGLAKSLRRRVGGYLVDFMKTRPTKHKGRAFVFEARHKHTDHGVWVRWTRYGGYLPDLEGSLIAYFNPQCNDRLEEDFFNDDELLDPRLVG